MTYPTDECFAPEQLNKASRQVRIMTVHCVRTRQCVSTPDSFTVFYVNFCVRALKFYVDEIINTFYYFVSVRCRFHCNTETWNARKASQNYDSFDSCFVILSFVQTVMY